MEPGNGTSVDSQEKLMKIAGPVLVQHLHSVDGEIKAQRDEMTYSESHRQSQE